MITLSHDVMLHAYYNFDITFRLLSKSIKRFFHEIWNGGKFIGVFQKHADDITSDRQIL